MGITDWDQWMKENNIYIPSTEEIERARKNNEIKVRRLQKDLEGAKNELENYRKKVSAK